MMQQQRSSSGGRRHATPPPAATLAEMAATRRPSSPLTHHTVSEPIPRVAPIPAPKVVSSSRSATPTAAMDIPSRSTSFGPLPSSRGASPSRDHYHDLVKRTYFGYQSQYPVDRDVSRREHALRPPKFIEKPLDPRINNYRGHTKCKWCAKFVLSNEMDEHLSASCPLLPIRCSLVDTETGVLCPAIAPGRESIQIHQQSCPFRTKRCENMGCGKAVSLQSMAAHLQHCSFEIVQCPQCGLSLARNSEAEHQMHCTSALVSCPLGCGEVLRRGDVAAHMRNTLLQHVPQYTHHPPSSRSSQRPADDDPQSVIAFLLSHILASEKQRHNGAPQSAIPSRSTSPQKLIARPTVAAAAPQSLNASHSDILFSLGTSPGTGPLVAPPPPPQLYHNHNENGHYNPPQRQDTGTQTLNWDSPTSIEIPLSPWVKYHEGTFRCRERPTLLRTLPTIEAQQSFLLNELHWHSDAFQQLTKALASRVQTAAEDGDDGSLDVSIASNHTPVPRSEQHEIPKDVDMNELTQSVALSMKALKGYVEQWQQQSGSGDTEGDDDVVHEWESLDRLWYEWKLAMYDTMFGE